MANAYIRVYYGRATDEKQVTDPAASGKYDDYGPIASGGTATIGARGHLARVICDGSMHFSHKSPVVTATTNMPYMAGDVAEYFGVEEGIVFSFLDK